MKVLTVWSLLFCLLAAATAQTLWDEFEGGFLPELGWRWDVPGNQPLHTEDTAGYAFVSGSLSVTMQPGALYGGSNSIRNLPNLRIPALPPGWSVETRLSLDLNEATGFYVQAGVILFTDANNYYNFHFVVMPDQNNRLSVSSGHEVNGNYQWGHISAPSWSRTQADIVRLLMSHHASTGQIHFYYDVEDGQFWRECAGSPRDPNAYPALQTVLQNGGRIGLYADLAGWSGTPAPVARFDYLDVFLPLPQGDVNENGCIDDADLLAVLFAFGRTGRCLPEDLDKNGYVEDNDLLIVLFEFGSGC